MIKNKARRLLLPYYLTCAAMVIIDVLRCVIKYAILGESRNIPDVLLYWFKASLFASGGQSDKTGFCARNWCVMVSVGDVFSIIIVNHFVEKKFGALIILLIAVIGWASCRYAQVWLPFSIQCGMLCSLYLLIGYKMRRCSKCAVKSRSVVFLLCGLVTAVAIKNFKGFWLVNNYMGNGWLDFIASVFASVLIFRISAFISDHANILKKILIFYGKNSLLILCLHIIDLNVFRIYEYTFLICDKLAEFVPGMYFSYNGILFLVLAIKIAYVTIGVIAVNKMPACRRIFVV